jgi:hypothetical protein
MRRNPRRSLRAPLNRRLDVHPSVTGHRRTAGVHLLRPRGTGIRFKAVGSGLGLLGLLCPSAGRGTCEIGAASGPERHLAPAGSAALWFARWAPGGVSPRGLAPCSAPSPLSLPPAGGFPSLRHPARLTALGSRRTARRLPPRGRSSSCRSSAARRGPARSCCWRRQNRADLRQIVAPLIVTPGSLRAARQCGGRSSASPCGCRSVRARSRRERDPGNEDSRDEAADVARRPPPAGRDGHAP